MGIFIIEELQKITIEFPVIINMATFTGGAIFGSYLAIGRDKRKEFNEVTEQSRIEIRKGIECTNIGVCGFSVDYHKFIAIEDHIPWYKRNLFRIHVKRCESINAEMYSEYDPNTSKSEFYKHKVPELNKRLKNILCYIKRR